MKPRLQLKALKPNYAKRKPPELAPGLSHSFITRPNVSWVHGLTRLMLLILGGIFISSIICYIYPCKPIHRLVITELCITTLAIVSARSNVVLAIRLYQRYAPAHVRMRCAMTPTCSEYAVLAIRRHGLLRGLWKTYCRLRHKCIGITIIDYP